MCTLSFKTAQNYTALSLSTNTEFLYLPVLLTEAVVESAEPEAELAVGPLVAPVEEPSAETPPPSEEPAADNTKGTALCCTWINDDCYKAAEQNDHHQDVCL